jgi:tetratricopeptide (TPR) repeat protein
MLVCIFACSGAAPTKLDPSAHRCVDAASCERAIVSADVELLPSLLESYAAATGNRGWHTLYDELQRNLRLVAFVGAEQGHIEGVAKLALPPATTELPRERLVLALARAAGHVHVLLWESGRGRQLFPQDVLAPHMLGLAPLVTLTPSGIPTALEVARTTRAMLLDAGSFDYVSAAHRAERLRALVAPMPHNNEGAMRARFALWLLDSAGIALAAPSTKAAPSAAADQEPTTWPAKLSSPYAELLAVQLSRPEHSKAWDARGKRITAGMSAARIRALARMYAPKDSCPAPLAPPIEHASDIAFAGLLAIALDEKAAPDEEPGAGKLSMATWLERYDTLVRVVDTSGSAWAALGSLLRQRGELFGLTAEGTTAYKRVTDLALAHMAALTKLAEAEPSRFQALGVVTLVYQPGVLSDTRLRPAVAKLVARSVELEIAQATNVSTLFDASLASFAAGMSFPAQLQNAQFGALASALEAKLSSPFGRATGWGVAGLHFGHAALGLLLGQSTAIEQGAARVAVSLKGDVENRALARLAVSAAGYARLSIAGALDATVSNPAMYTAARSRARSQLGQAVATLAEPGPTTAPQKQLHQELTDLADTLVAATATHATADESGPQCAGESAIADGTKLREAFNRLRKKRKAMLAGRAFDKGDEVWTRRARLVALILSDLLDYVDQREGKLSFAISTSRASQIVDEALKGWIDHAGAELAAGSYLLARGGFDPASSGTGMPSAVRALSALGTLFAGDRGSLFATLAKLGTEAGSGEANDVGSLITGYARRAYSANAPDHGDLLLMIRLAVSVMRDRDVDQRSIDLANAHGRAVYLPLLMYGPRTSANASKLRAAMRSATGRGCNPPDPEAVLAVDSAIASFKAGERDKAITTLDELLDIAEEKGLVVPRQVFRFEQHAGKKVFNAEQSVSFGNQLLRGASAFQLGLGFQSREESKGSMRTTFADPTSPRASEEAARYFAHAATIEASYAFLQGREHDAIRAARRAIGVWINGARLGNSRVYVGSNTARWARDATAILLIAGQQAADAGLIFLASDLWTLAKAGLAPSTDDASVDSLLQPLPEALTGIDEVAPVALRAKKNLTILAMGLPCTQKNGAVADMVRVQCAAYPTALALRATDSLQVLPRLKKAGAQTATCAAWSKLDHLLAALDQGRYEPKRLIDSVSALTSAQRFHDAASVLTRHRHPDHCNPKLVTLSRKLGAHVELGIHLRADLLSIATNCAPSEEVEADLLALDVLTQKHALPTRNFQALLFATRLALKDNVWQPLAKMSGREGFIQQYNALGPDFGTAALLVHHAAAVGAGNTIDKRATLPFYRLLCTTFPPKERSAMCHAVSSIRGSGAAADKKRTAAKALADFLQRGARAMQPRP